MTSDSAPLDTTIRIVTPENIAFDYELAGPFPRLLAFLIDLAAIVGLCMALGNIYSFIAPLVGSAGVGFLFLAYFFVFWGYGGLFETFWNGQTLGKRALSLRVVSTSGLPINAAQAMLRNILRIAGVFFLLAFGSAVIGLLSIGFFAMAATRRFQRLGDLAAQTMVVREKRHRLAPLRVASGELDAVDQQIPLAFEADGRLAEALGAYVARRGDVSPERRVELASILAEPYVRRWNLPRNTDPDLLLCALYHRAYFGGSHERAAAALPQQAETPAPEREGPDGDNPFAKAESPAPASWEGVRP